MKRKKLLMLPPREPEKKKGIYIVSTLQEVDDAALIEIDCYNGQKLLFRYFADKERKERATWYEEHEKWYTVKLENALADMQNHARLGYWSYGEPEPWLNKAEEERAKDYFGRYSVSGWEYSMDGDKRYEAQKRKFDRIQEEIDEFPLIPDGVEKWVTEKLTPEHFLFIRHDEKETKWSCTACGGSGQTDLQLKIGKENSCPACGKRMKGKKAGMIVEHKIPVIVMQTDAAKSKYCEKQLKAHVFWDEDGKTVKMDAEAIVIAQKGASSGRVYYGQRACVEEPEQEWWTRNTGRHLRESWVYPYNLDEIIGPMLNAEHSGIMEMLKSSPFDVNKWIYWNFINWPPMEYLFKRGLYRIARETVECPKDSSWMYEIMDYIRRDKNAANRLRILDGGLLMANTLMVCGNQNVKDHDLLTLERMHIDAESGGLSRALAYKSITRICNYLDKNRANGQFLIEWNDYLRMAEDLGEDLNDDIVIFPRDLHARHDEKVRIIAKKKDEIRAKKMKDKDKEIRKHLPKMKKYEWTDGWYTIFPATCCEDLMRESRELHHCVGTSDNYMDKMAQGRTWIFFLRMKDTPEAPYYTIELDLEKEQILQWYSAYDRKPEAKIVEAVLSAWRKETMKRRKTA